MKREARGKKDEEISGGQSEHTHIKFAILNRCGLWHSQIITTVTSMITDHHNKYNKNKIIIFCNSYQNVTDTK